MHKLQEFHFWNIIQLVMLFTFFVSIVYRSVGLRIRHKINPFKLNILENHFLGILEISLFVVVSIWAVEVMFYSIPSDFQIFAWPFNIVLFNDLLSKSSGLVISILAFGLLFWGLKSLGDSWRFGIDEMRSGELVTDGIYGFTRNPIYLFFNLWFLGTFLMNGRLIFLCFALFTMINLHFQIMMEEDFLRKIHGATFVKYCQNTPRYFSWKGFITNRKLKTQVSTESLGE